MPNNVAIIAFMSWDYDQLGDENIGNIDFKSLLEPGLLARINQHPVDTGFRWYDENVKRWGVKLDVYDQAIHRIAGDGSPTIFSFCSAWNVPNKNTMLLLQTHMLDTYPIKDIIWQYHEPHDNTIHPLKVMRVQNGNKR